MRVGRYQLDGAAHKLIADDDEIALSPLATRLIELLSRTPGEIVDRNAIIDELWRGDFLVGDPALHRLVSETRRALSGGTNPQLQIHTVHRRGYRLLVDNASKDANGRADTRYRRGWIAFAAAFLLIVLVAVAAKLVIDALVGLQGAHALYRYSS